MRGASNQSGHSSAPGGGVPQHHHHHNHPGVPAPGQFMMHGNSLPGQEHSGLLYDLSSFDPLQAHALQLTASAGLTNLLPPPPAPTSYQHTNGDVNSQQQQQNLMNGQQQQQQQTHHQANPQQPYYYMQTQGSGPSSLQPIAPAVGQGLSPAPAPQSFLLPGTAVGPAQNYAQQILPGHLSAAPVPAQNVLPSLLMTQHLLSVVANATQHPAPLAPAINISQKREGEEFRSGDRQSSKKRTELAPSVVSSYTHSTGNGARKNSNNNNSNSDKDGLDGKPPQEATQAELDRMTPAERRRYERNLREQQRSYKISQQIKELRDVLSESNVPYKPNKYSILLSVVDYIKQLQARAIMLDTEHQKLITTIRQTNEMVNSGTTPSSADEMETTNTTNSSDTGSDNEMLFVQGLDYRSVFEQCPAALGIAALDGRIMECNPEFQLLLGFPRDELLKHSLFNLVRNHQDIFRAMAEMLKGAETPVGGGGNQTSEMGNRFWNGEVISKRDAKLAMNLTLTMADDGTPKFFNCALTSIA